MRAELFGCLMLLTSMAAVAQVIQTESLPPLKQAVSNNAVTLVSTGKGVYLYSFLGLGSGKTWQDISSAAFVLEPGAKTWTELDPVAGPAGRLAASAVSLGGAAWLFGGYTVAADGSERSTAGVYRIRPGQFLASDECWLGSIDTENHRSINWRKAPGHPGAARYRMAATGNINQQIVFAGGSANPYNFNGIGYNGIPAESEASVFSYSFKSGGWQSHGHLPEATMDHRGLPYSNGWYYLVGGMQEKQTVVPDVYRFRILPLPVPVG